MGKAQINNIIAGKEKIIEEWDGGVNERRKLLAVRKCAYVDLNAKVYAWFSTARANNIPFTVRLLQEKAAMFVVEMGHKDFTASNGWLNRFQIRHNVKASLMSGESAEVKEEVVQEWARRLKYKTSSTPMALFSLVAREFACRQS